jgi:hypothetical protein
MRLPIQLLIVALFVLVPLVAAEAAWAQLITFEAHGHMTDAQAPDFQVGDAFVADFTFDAATPADSTMVPDFDAQYLAVVSWTFKFDNGYAFGATADSVNPFAGVIEITNDKVDPTLGYTTATDRYIVTFDTPTSSGQPIPSGRDFSFFQFDFFDNEPTGTPDLLSSDAIPITPPSIALATYAVGRLVYDGSGIPDQPYFAVDSIAVVSEPASIVLLLLATAGPLSLVIGAKRELIAESMAVGM